MSNEAIDPVTGKPFPPKGHCLMCGIDLLRFQPLGAGKRRTKFCDVLCSREYTRKSTRRTPAPEGDTVVDPLSHRTVRISMTGAYYECRWCGKQLPPPQGRPKKDCGDLQCAIATRRAFNSRGTLRQHQQQAAPTLRQDREFYDVTKLLRDLRTKFPEKTAGINQALEALDPYANEEVARELAKYSPPT